MYGTIFRMKVRAGHEDEVIKAFEAWDSDRKPTLPGAIGSLLMRPDRGSGALIGVAVFQDEAAYRANADAPEQGKWYQGLRGHLESDPEWEDGEYVSGSVG